MAASCPGSGPYILHHVPGHYHYISGDILPEGTARLINHMVEIGVQKGAKYLRVKQGYITVVAI